MPDDMVEAHIRGVSHALAAGWRVLERGGLALDAVEEAVVIMEDDETFDAGRGSFLNRDGRVQLDALIMEARIPSSVAKDGPETGLPPESDLFAGDVNDPTVSHDTVGAVALDSNANIAAATSTGGTLNKAPGRLGDSSLIGCGCYADNESAAASTTGWGEPIMKLVLAKWTADRIAAGNLPEWSAQEAMNYLKQRVNGHGGIIVLNREGHIGIAHNTPRMAWAYRTVKNQESGITREN
jgi:L-asparaginase / beta-aspartyl-peptidase